MQKCVVVIPTYNEANNLPVLAAELWALKIPGLSILVVDGNSPDGTGDIADELAKQRPGEIFSLHLSSRGGLRRAYVAGFKWALSHEADIVVQMDCDFSHSPSYIHDFLEGIQKADLVIGSRYVPGGKLDDRMSASTYLQSWWANAIYARTILNLEIKDATTGFRCWRAEALRGIDLDAIISNGYSFQIEMVYVAEKLGYKIIEIPIHYEDRRLGQSKLRWPDKVEAAFRTWQIWWRYRDFPQTEQSAELQKTLDATNERQK
jgi:dolichol-phosphate mannosyltransferase